MNFNSLSLKGNLTRDVELRSTKSGKTVGSFSIAVNRGWGDNKRTMFVECTAWEKTADTINKYFSKGSAIIVTGKLDENSWVDKDGNKRTKNYILVKSFDFCGDNRQSKTEVPERAVYNEPVQQYNNQPLVPEPSFSNQSEQEESLPF